MSCTCILLIVQGLYNVKWLCKSGQYKSCVAHQKSPLFEVITKGRLSSNVLSNSYYWPPTMSNVTFVLVAFYVYVCQNGTSTFETFSISFLQAQFITHHYKLLMVTELWLEKWGWKKCAISKVQNTRLDLSSVQCITVDNHTLSLGGKKLLLCNGRWTCIT